MRGSTKPSEDGKTYLSIVDDNGGKCGPILVDGKVWQYELNEAGPISPGTHTIECGTKIEFTIPDSVIFRFDYWGRKYVYPLQKGNIKQIPMD
ncbi:hypothetical protein [Fodinibius halophilus]|uniref:hypothetical protein n=1 Tax=Fodinibius halophilus TaxID=1736908 RepID=UPI00197A9BD4|nr:hypothetical protein [Fodinibius halophilus]